MRVVHIVSAFGPTSTARHLAHVLPKVASERLVFNLGSAEPFEPVLRSAGVPVRTPSFHGPLDVASVRAIVRDILAFAPRVVHVWGDRAAAFANLLALHPFREPNFAIVVGDLAPGTRSPLVRRVLRIARAVRDSVPIVETTPVAPTNLGLPDGARIILNVGGFEVRTDQRAAVWSFDMLRYTDRTAHLVMVGDGPMRKKVEAFARSIMRGDPRVHFVGVRTDVPALLRSSAIAFATHRSGGRTFLAESLAAGTPVVAVETPETRSLVRDGENGLLVRRGNHPAQAYALLRILSDPELASRLSAGARASRFPTPDEAARDLDEFYRTLGG